MLSLAGRIMLIQASLAAIPSYVMQCTHLPIRILDGIDRVNRNFLWCSMESTNKVHWVGWQKLTRSKAEGGLGLQSSRGRNVALLTKLNWRFIQRKRRFGPKFYGENTILVMPIIFCVLQLGQR